MKQSNIFAFNFRCYFMIRANRFLHSQIFLDKYLFNKWVSNCYILSFYIMIFQTFDGIKKNSCIIKICIIQLLEVENYLSWCYLISSLFFFTKIIKSANSPELNSRISKIWFKFWNSDMAIFQEEARMASTA